MDSFIVEILDADNAQVLEMTYAELKEQLKTPMELKVGAYRMEVRSEDTMPDAAWEHPVYGATSDFTITKAQTTSPEEVVCTLQNIKVSVEYSPELADMLADTSKATVSLGDTSLDFLKTETRAAYFKPQALENTLDFVFDGTFADTDVPAKFSKQITGVKAGQWRKVSVVIGYADKGNILFSVKVDNSILQDNKFVVDGTENLGEELLEDPNAPALTWPGHDMTQPFTLTDAMFDAEGNCIEPFAFDLSSPNGIESLQVTVGSTNSQFLASMAAIQLPETFDLCTLDASSAAGIILKGFGYPVGSELKGQTAKSFNIAGQIRALYEFDGTHTFAFTMTDAKGVSSEAVLTLVVDKSSGQTGPRITWRGYDIDQQYEVQKDMVIDIDIEADKGIKSFFVTIDSETLRPLLPVINLPEKFDICDIPDELVEVLHGEFGYAFTARPSAMKVKYHAHVGTVDKVRTSGDICPYIKKGDPDMARIFVAIVDWNAPHEVVSGMTTTKGAWDPEKGIDNVSEGKILGYGSLWITQSTEGEDMQDAELDIVWYDHETRPAEGNYSLVISCACNAYGDYFTGCSKNVMYVDDFEWVY